MPRLNVPLTRSTLLETQRSLSFAREGYDLLDRKREVLIAEILDMVDDAEAVQSDLIEGFTRAYAALVRARISLGVEEVKRAALSVDVQAEVKVTERSIMGAEVPDVELSKSQQRPRYSPAETSADLDEAVQAFSGLLKTVAEAAETEISVWRLAAEIRKTQRRVNALRNIVIPNYERIIKIVQEALEEGERESFYRAKMFKRILQRRSEERK